METKLKDLVASRRNVKISSLEGRKQAWIYIKKSKMSEMGKNEGKLNIFLTLNWYKNNTVQRDNSKNALVDDNICIS